jgi:hypothetical protein
MKNGRGQPYLTFYLVLKFESGSQIFGGFDLDSPTDGGVKTGTFDYWLKGVFDVVYWDGNRKPTPMYSLDDLVGKSVRAVCNFNGVYAIGNILRNRWLCPYFREPNGIYENYEPKTIEQYCDEAIDYWINKAMDPHWDERHNVDEGVWGDGYTRKIDLNQLRTD